MQKFSKTLAIMGLMTPFSAGALGTGEIKLYSALNQRLNAEVALVVSADEPVDDLRVSLAPAEAFAKAGVERPFYLTGLRFEVLPKGKGRAVPTVKITSADAIREPFVNFLIDLQWSQGHVVREFTLLLDPPSTFKERTVVARSAPQAESLATEGLHATPESLSGAEYGPVRKGETLWSIAKVVNSDRNVSIEQMVVALYEANPQAFPKPNIFSFQPGVKLHIPNKNAVLARGLAEAKKVIDEHNAIWRGKAVPAKAASGPAPAATAAPEGEKPLTLLAPERAAASATPKKPGGTASKGELALEIADTVKQENEDIRGRLAGLEQQVQLMQRLLSLKDQQIAALQAGKPMPAALPGAEATATQQPPLPLPPSVAAVQPSAAAPQIAAKPPEPAPLAAKPVETAVPPPPPPSMLAVPVQPVAELAKTPQEPTPPATAPAPAPVQPPAVEPPKQPAVPAQPVAAAKPPVQAPAPQPVPTPAIEEAGWFGGDSLVVGLLGAVGLLIGGLALLAVKRRRAALAELDAEMPAPEIRPIDLTQAAESRPPQEGGGASGLLSPSQHGSFLSDFTPSDFDVLDSDNEAIDPISEADVYLAYGRYSQAEELIRQAINENPFRDECKLKLLEVFYTAQNRDAFEKYVGELLEENKNSDHDFWVRVVDMGRSLAPENPIFNRGRSDTATSMQTPMPPAGAVPSARSAPTQPQPASAALESADFSFDLDEDDAFAAIEAAGEAFQSSLEGTAAETTLPPQPVDRAVPAAQPEAQPELSPLPTEQQPTAESDFEMPVEAAPPAQPIMQEEARRAPVPAKEKEEASGLDFDLGSFEVPAAAPVVEQARQTPAQAKEERGLDFDLGSFEVQAATPVKETAAAPQAEERSALEFDASSLGQGGFSFAGVMQSTQEPEAAVAEDQTRHLEFAPPSTPEESAAPPLVPLQDEQKSPTAKAPASDPEFDFDLNRFADMAPALPAATSPKDEGDDEEFNFDMNFDFSGPSLGDAGEESDLVSSQELSDMDEVETKLDLAKAYVDMDNLDAAKLMLEDVIQSGDERQKSEARALMDKLASPTA